MKSPFLSAVAENMRLKNYAYKTVNLPPAEPEAYLITPSKG